MCNIPNCSEITALQNRCNLRLLKCQRLLSYLLKTVNVGGHLGYMQITDPPSDQICDTRTKIDPWAQKNPEMQKIKLLQKLELTRGLGTPLLIARQIGQKQDEATASSCLMVVTALNPNPRSKPNPNTRSVGPTCKVSNRLSVRLPPLRREFPLYI